MFLVKRKEKFKIIFDHTEETTKHFSDLNFIPILNFIESKGLSIPIPTIIEGWDASFIYRNLVKNPQLGKSAERLSLFLYMRLRKSDPILLEHIIFYC